MGESLGNSNVVRKQRTQQKLGFARKQWRGVYECPGRLVRPLKPLIRRLLLINRRENRSSSSIAETTLLFSSPETNEGRCFVFGSYKTIITRGRTYPVVYDLLGPRHKAVGMTRENLLRSSAQSRERFWKIINIRGGWFHICYRLFKGCRRLVMKSKTKKSLQVTILD